MAQLNGCIPIRQDHCGLTHSYRKGQGRSVSSIPLTSRVALNRQAFAPTGHGREPLRLGCEDRAGAEGHHLTDLLKDAAEQLVEAGAHDQGALQPHLALQAGVGGGQSCGAGGDLGLQFRPAFQVAAHTMPAGSA